MLSTDSRPFDKPDLSRRPAVLALLGLVGGVSLLVLVSPLAESLAVKAFFLAVPILLLVLVSLSELQTGFRLWALALTALVSQTGFQLDVVGLRISALEVTLLFLLILLGLSWGRLPPPRPRLPGQRFLFLLLFYGVALLLLSLLQGIELTRSLPQFKGFLLYPLMAYVFVAAGATRRWLRWMVVLLVGWYLYVAGVAAVEFFSQNAAGADVLYRASAEYAPQNILGTALAAVSLFVLGLSLQARNRVGQMVGLGAALALFLGALMSVSRTALVAFAAGLLVLFVLLVWQRRRRLAGLSLLLVAVMLLPAALPEEATGRLLQLDDSSSYRRTFYLVSGVHAWRARWLTGWGWGQAFWVPGSSGTYEVTMLGHYLVAPQLPLSSTGGQPWYHNDYVNLAVQTGVIGLGLFLLFWQRVLAAGRRWLAEYGDTACAGYVQGSLAALVALLASGFFEHVLWRPDAAGLLGLMLGIMVAAMRTAEPAGERA